MSDNIEELYSVKVERNPESGAVISQTWFNQDGVEESVLGPSRTEYDQTNGQACHMHWKVDGKLHRPEHEGPAVIKINFSDQTKTQEFRKNGALHRMSGPAIIISCERSGQVLSTRYFTEGRYYDPNVGPSNMVDLNP